MLKSNSKFKELENCERIWAIGSIHGNIISLKKIHEIIKDNFKKNDEIVYLGNVIGVGGNSVEVIGEILKFRLYLMAKYQLDNNNFVFLRGAQEEMWSKLLNLHISPNPKEVLSWMIDHGVDKTLTSYNIDHKEILKSCELGSIILSKLITKIKKEIEMHSGHNEYYSNLLHAAYTSSKKILFVNRGVDISRPLSAQNDCFWWGYQGLSNISNPYGTFTKIVRGYDPRKIGPQHNNIVCSLYIGSGFGEGIVMGLFNNYGDTIKFYEC